MSVRLGYGLITCQSHPDDPRSTTALVAEALDLAREAERVGLDSVWVSEHHHVDDGHLGALLTMLAAMAAVTTSVRLGTGVLLAPLHDPVRIAEEAALVDQISQGRLVVGLGLGWREEEFAAVGARQSDRVRALTEVVEVLRRAGRGDGTRVNDDGTAFARVTPGFTSAGGVPIWVGALAEAGIARAGRIADGFMATEVTPAELGEQVAVARTAAAEAGRDPADLTISVHLPTLVTDLPWEQVRDRLRYPGWKYDDMYGQWGSAGPLGRPGAWGDGEEERLQATSLVGNAEQVASRIEEYSAAAGGDLDFIARSYLPGVGPQEQLRALVSLGGVADLLNA